MKLSVVIPCHNEAEGISEAVHTLTRELDAAHLDYEVVAVDDGSTDGTGEVLHRMAAQDATRDTAHDSRSGGQGAVDKVNDASFLVREDGHGVSRDSSLMDPSFSRLRVVKNEGEHGFGMAVRCGIEQAKGDAVIIFMADMSDSPSDVVAYARKLEEGYECVFGSRFIPGGRVIDYPLHKLILNRLANGFIKVLFGLRLNDTTNAFKAYRREVIQGISPLFSKHFNLTVEMPLKAIARGDYRRKPACSL